MTATDEDMAGIFKFSDIGHEASGGGYDSVSVQTVFVTVTDDDVTNIVYETGSPGNLRERSSFGTYEGSAHSYYVSLTSEPTAAVTITLASEDVSRVTVSPDSVTFSTTNWNVAQPVSFSVADNDVLGEDRVQVRVTSTISGTGSNYDGQLLRPFTVNVFNNDREPETVTEGDSLIYELGYEEYPGAYLIRAESVRGAVTIAPASVQVTEDNYERLPFTVTGVEAGQGKINFWIWSYLVRSFLVTVGPPAIPTRLTLSANRRAREGGRDVTLTARLNSPAPAGGTEVTLRVGAETTATLGVDYTLSATEFTIAEGDRTGTATLRVIDDADDDDGEVVQLLADSRNPELSSAGLRLDIRDDDVPSVTLSASPNPVPEGSSVTVTARLSTTLSSSVTIPLTLTAGTAEEDDFGPLSGIEIDAGSTRGTGTISTTDDEDADSETFTVALGRLPSSLQAGSPGSVEVTIADFGPINVPPAVAAYCDPCRVGPGGGVRLTAVASDPDGDQVTCVWSAQAGSFLGAVDEFEARWQAPADTGTVWITVDVSDGFGGTAFAEVAIEVTNAAPVFEEPFYAFELRENEDGRSRPVALDAVVAVDPDGDEVTYSLAAGDGTRFTVGSRDGTVQYVGAGEDYEAEPHRYELSVRARDPHGAAAMVGVTVELTNANEAPAAAADTAATTEDGEVTVDVLANDADPDGDALHVESVSPPAHGTARIAAGGGVAYTPEADWHGTDRFEYTAADGNGGTGVAEVAVRVAAVNDPPMAVADTAATNEDEPVTMDVLANDTDVDGDALHIESVSAPGHGTARIAAGRVEYAPEADWHGTDRFAYTVADDNGGRAVAEVEVRVTAVNDPPVAVGAIPDQALEEGGAASALDLAPYFEDRDGDALTYAAVSSDPNVAAVTVAGAALTVTPVGYGSASIEVTARDPDGLSAAHTFAVGSNDRMARIALDETLAATARAHLASARMTLGRHVRPGGRDERSRLTVLGRAIPLDEAGVRAAADRLLAGWTMSRYLRGGGLAEAGRTFERQAEEWAAAAAEGRDGPPAGPRDPSDLMVALGVRGPPSLRELGGGGGRGGGGTEFTFAWGGDDGGRPGWRLWGQGDIQTFSGEPAAERGYEGSLRTGWAGLDRALGGSWLAGVAVARSRGGSDWRAGTAGGRLETSLTAVHPYLRWSNGGTSVWAMAGGGWGSAENARGTGRVGTSSLDMGLGLLEVRRRFANWFGLRGDAAWARLATGEGAETVDGRGATVQQQRLGIEVSPSLRLGALALEVFGEASGRHDGGAGQTGGGLELAGGLRAAGGLVRLDAQGRILVLHSARGYEERGLGVTLTIGSPSDEEGLSLSVAPRWGGPATSSGALWQEQVAGSSGPTGPAPIPPWSLDARARWALRLPGGRLIAWSGSLDHSTAGWGLTISGGIERARRPPPRPPAAGAGTR
ncbi:MAG: tandem-95 repeat protein [Gemmatimonadota bacterium]|uniref:Ig-like domain-containing protein n=1 Tax=Candidatus Palauibacter scopulicola TaxID=3056741 RepID=UPI0023907F5C|nr:tandem-95 repeat protein [Candidatus Palauibacter scopulicola]MDE2663242.1 tandem-95 repeat protein [Candidatus Palauibacter scopulicola]